MGKLRKMLPKIKKTFAVEYPKIFTLLITGIILIALSGVLVLHGLWQIDLFAMPFIWRPATDGLRFYQDLIGNGISSYSQVPATDFFLHTSVGGMMDTMLALITVGWVMGMVGVGLIGLSLTMFISQQSQVIDEKNENERNVGERRPIVDLKIRKVKVLEGVAKQKAEEKNLSPNDLVVVKTINDLDSIIPQEIIEVMKIEKDAVSFLNECANKSS